MGKDKRQNAAAIWSARAKEALAMVAMAGLYANLTGHEFCKDEIKYWRAIHKLAQKNELRYKG